MKCLIPNFTYEPEKLETWLNQKLADGLALKKWGILFAYFEENSSGILLYQIDIDDSRGEPNWDRMTKLAEHGWEYVKTIHENFHIYSTASERAEMPREWALWREGVKRIRRNAVMQGILTVFYLLIFLLSLSMWRFWLLGIMRTHWALTLAYATFLSYIIGKFGLGTIRAWKLAKRMEQERKLTFDKVSDWRQWMEICEYMLLLVMVIPLVLKVAGRLEQYENVDQMGAKEKFVDLRLVEDEEFEITHISWAEHPNVNFGNRIQHKPVLFAGRYYQVEQYGNYKNEAEEYVQLSGEYWNVSSDWISERLYDQLYRRYVEFEKYGLNELRVRRLYKLMWEVETEVPEGFLDFVVAQGMEDTGPYSTTQIFARTGDYVIYLEYTGATGSADSHRLTDALQSEFIR